ncbi:hypothetical protein STRDD11_02382 [Streptococcus sp. DD11]|uniref:hypothetical protein n=1 Tax=Streptococcus sp. DD11 TaxID=1777879 RepID=UPI00079B24FE|nr:hypothetical protein [Streptococcus sp. DD11]KXT78823.1 hypothetical protein STRDD11_02382 [Streptococcus sp. DD11]
MARQNYFDLIQNMNFDPTREIEIISELLSETYDYHFKRHRVSGRSEKISYSIERIFNETFNNYPINKKHQFVSYDEVENFIFEKADNELDKLFIFLEFLIDLFSFLTSDRHIDFPFDQGLLIDIYGNTFYYEKLFDQFAKIENRANYFLNILNHELITLENGDKIIVEKNVYASEVSQILSETSIEDAIRVLEYNHFSNKGDIQRKKEILISLANYLEPLRKELNNSEELKEVFKVNNNKIIAFEKLFEMYNNLGLRHNNLKQYHQNMSDEELERWYDDIYTSTLFVILSLDEARILSQLEALKAK